MICIPITIEIGLSHMLLPSLTADLKQTLFLVWDSATGSKEHGGNFIHEILYLSALTCLRLPEWLIQSAYHCFAQLRIHSGRKAVSTSQKHFKSYK